MMIMRALDFLSNNGLGFGLLDEGEAASSLQPRDPEV